VARQLHVTNNTVGKWRSRYIQSGLAPGICGRFQRGSVSEGRLQAQVAGGSTDQPAGLDAPEAVIVGAGEDDSLPARLVEGGGRGPTVKEETLRRRLSSRAQNAELVEDRQWK